MRAVNISYADRHFEGVNETDWDAYALEHFGCEMEPDRNDDVIDRLVPRLARELGHAGFDAGGDWQWDDKYPNEERHYIPFKPYRVSPQYRAAEVIPRYVPAPIAWAGPVNDSHQWIIDPNDPEHAAEMAEGLHG